jgi:hypothetical protein
MMYVYTSARRAHSSCSHRIIAWWCMWLQRLDADMLLSLAYMIHTSRSIHAWYNVAVESIQVFSSLSLNRLSFGTSLIFFFSFLNPTINEPPILIEIYLLHWSVYRSLSHSDCACVYLRAQVGASSSSYFLITDDSHQWSIPYRSYYS